MTHRLAAAIAITCGLFLPASVEAAGPSCAPRGYMLKQLADKYREAPIAVGVTHNGGLIEVLSNAEGKTWSIIITSPQGMSCPVAAGEGWRSFVQPPQRLLSLPGHRLKGAGKL